MERLIASRMRRQRLEFLAKWSRGRRESWVPESVAPAALIREFNERRSAYRQPQHRFLLAASDDFMVEDANVGRVTEEELSVGDEWE